MLEAQDFVLVQSQAVIFTPGLQFRIAQVLSTLLGKYGSIFDAEPSVLPAFEGLPFEAPRLLLQSQDGTLRLQAGPARLDLIQGGENLDATRPLGAFLAWSLGLFDEYIKATDARVGRLACVVNRHTQVEHPAKALAAHFCKPELLQGALRRPSDFEVHAAKQFHLMDDYQINSWLRCKTTVVSPGGPTPRQVVLVEQDFNTRPEEADQREFKTEDRRRFFEKAPDGLRHVLELYFPREGA